MKTVFLVTHRDDGVVFSDRCGDGLSAVHAQAVRRYIELLYRGIASQNMSKHYASACLQLLPITALQVQLGDSVLADLLDGNPAEDFEVGLVNDGKEELSGVRVETIRINMELLTRQSEQRKQGMEERKDSQKEVAANRNDGLIAHLNHRCVTLQQLCHDECPAIHVKPLSAVV